MDIHQARTEANQGEMEAKMDIHQENMKAVIHSIRSKLEETSNIGWKTPCRVSDQKCELSCYRGRHGCTRCSCYNGTKGP
jgi:hypothetical protein